MAVTTTTNALVHIGATHTGYHKEATRQFNAGIRDDTGNTAHLDITASLANTEITDTTSSATTGVVAKCIQERGSSPLFFLLKKT